MATARACERLVAAAVNACAPSAFPMGLSNLTSFSDKPLSGSERDERSGMLVDIIVSV